MKENKILFVTKKDLEDIGFINIKRFDWRNVDYEIKDWSRDYLPKHYNNGEMIPLLSTS